MVIERGIEEGWITPASRTHLGPAQRFPAPLSTAEVLDEDRDDSRARPLLRGR